MKYKFTRLAVVTLSADRSERIRVICVAEGWRLLSLADHDQPHRWLSQQRADLAIVDLDYPNAVGIIADSLALDPNLPVLALARYERFRDLQNAMLAGAQGFVIDPIETDAFLDSARKLMTATRPEATRAGRDLCVAVVSLKGGVGKSTIAANLALALQQQSEESVILAEAHHNLSDQALMLNLFPPHNLSLLADETEIDLELMRGLLAEHATGLRLLPASGELAEMVALSAATWRSLLALLNELSPIVVVDTSPNADVALEEVLAQADIALVVANPEMPSLHHAVDLIGAIRADARTAAEPHLILNRADVPGGVALRDIQQRLGGDVFATLPYDPGIARYALNSGVPFVLSNPRSRLSRSVTGLAQRLLKPPTAVAAPAQAKRTPAPLGWWRRLFAGSAA